MKGVRMRRAAPRPGRRRLFLPEGFVVVAEPPAWTVAARGADGSDFAAGLAWFGNATPRDRAELAPYYP